MTGITVQLSLGSVFTLAGIRTDAARLINASPGQLLQAAKMANFLVEHAGQVKPTIRILGRLAAVSAAEVN